MLKFTKEYGIVRVTYWQEEDVKLNWKVVFRYILKERREREKERNKNKDDRKVG
jgi:hypothetical protein